jgi:hypothetical protein
MIVARLREPAARPRRIAGSALWKRRSARVSLAFLLLSAILLLQQGISSYHPIFSARQRATRNLDRRPKRRNIALNYHFVKHNWQLWAWLNGVVQSASGPHPALLQYRACL